MMSHVPSPMMRWGLIFLACPLPLTDKQKNDLALLAARAYFEDESTIGFDWGEVRGEVRATSEAMALGAFYGQRFEAMVYRPESKVAKVEFLVTEAQLQQFGSKRPIAEA